MYKLLLIPLLFGFSRVCGQGGDTTLRRPDSTVPVVVEKDPRIDLLVRKQIEINDLTTRESRRFVPGYRVQVMNSTDRQKVFEAKARIYEQFPDWKPYLLYQSPYYKLRVGNFKTEEEAQDAVKQLSRLFPSGLYVVPDTIELKLSEVPRADTTNQ